MQEGQLLRTQADRDRLVTLKKAKKKLIKQRQAAEDLGVSVRHIKRLLQRLKHPGDKVVIHGLRGVASKRRIGEEGKQRAIEILSREEYEGFGPTLAREYLNQRHELEASRETVRKWMIEAKLWRAGRRKIEVGHVWRPAEPVRGDGAMGHPRTRLAGQGAEVVPDGDDRRRHQPGRGPVGGE